MYFVLKNAVNDLQKLESTHLASQVGTRVRIRQVEDNSRQVYASRWLQYHFNIEQQELTENLVPRLNIEVEINKVMK